MKLANSTVESLNKMFSVLLKVRLLREWQKSNKMGESPFSERELLTMEMINGFDSITEKDLTKLLGVGFSSVSGMVSKLTNLELIGKPEGTRGKPLFLTQKGQECLKNIKQASVIGYDFICASLNEEEKQSLMSILSKIENDVIKNMRSEMFQE